MYFYVWYNFTCFSVSVYLRNTNRELCTQKCTQLVGSRIWPVNNVYTFYLAVCAGVRRRTINSTYFARSWQITAVIYRNENSLQNLFEIIKLDALNEITVLLVSI